MTLQKTKTVYMINRFDPTNRIKYLKILGDTAESSQWTLDKRESLPMTTNQAYKTAMKWNNAIDPGGYRPYGWCEMTILIL